jgi:agmatine deiminase
MNSNSAHAYVANGAVIGARFGDPVRDEDARQAIAWTFPKRKIVMLRIDNIADGGGGIHCLTQPMPSI